MLTFEPLTIGNWEKFVDLFGERGACGGCWCTHWKMNPKQFRESCGATAYEFQKMTVASGIVPGLLAFENNQAVGWIAVEPRSQYPRMEKARSTKSADNQEVWSISCFFTRKSHRRRGVSTELLKYTVEYARSKGAKILEGYPTDTKLRNFPDAFVYTGLSETYQSVGFTEVKRNTPTRPVFRLML
ncbi:MAG TPA: GNAT family N-acetyltransferase [Anaerolineales bacterium]|nr:GNAT family N-acetyltransferase [Anaerolineales bacterium]